MILGHEIVRLVSSADTVWSVLRLFGGLFSQFMSCYTFAYSLDMIVSYEKYVKSIKGWVLVNSSNAIVDL